MNISLQCLDGIRGMLVEVVAQDNHVQILLLDHLIVALVGCDLLAPFFACLFEKGFPNIARGDDLAVVREDALIECVSSAADTDDAYLDFLHDIHSFA